MLKTQANDPSLHKPGIVPHFTSSRSWLWLIPLLLLTTWLTASHLDGAFWNDEVITVERAGSPIHDGPFSPLQIWKHTATTTYDQVPGYFWLVAAWDNALGWSEFSTRLLSLLAGILGVAFVYRLGRDLHSPVAGLGAAAALASSAFFVVYLHEARAYALSVLLSTVTIWLYWQIISRPTGWRMQIMLALCAAGLLYTHYFAALIVFAICLYHLLFVPKNREWWRVVIIMIAAGILFLPWFLTSFDVVQGAAGQEWRQEMSLTPREVTSDLLGLFANQNVALLLLLGALALALRRPAQRYGWFMLIAPFALALLVNEWIGMLVMPKYLLVLWVPMALIFGFGLARMTEKGIHPALMLIPWLLVGTWSSLNWEEDPVKYIAWDVLRDQLVEQVRPDDAIVFHLSAGLWDGVHQRALNHYFHDFPDIPKLMWSWPHVSDDVYMQDFPSIVEGKQRVWSAHDPQQTPPRINKFVEAMQASGFTGCGLAASDPLMAVDLFVQPPQSMPFQFGGDLYDSGITMTLLGPVTAASDGGLMIPIGWRAGEDVPINTYSFAVHILDTKGAVAAQADVGLPPNSEFGCQVLHIRDLAPGTYQAGLVVYAWETGVRLNAFNAAGFEYTDQQADLGTLTKGA